MNKNLLIGILITTLSLLADDKHLLNEIDYKSIDDSFYNMVVEIPSGTSEKWEVSKKSGQLKLEYVDDKPRIVDFLPYVGNYGFIPKTKLLKSKGGDGDPIDVLLLSPSYKRGEIVNIKIIGGLNFLDRGEVDTKLIGVSNKGSLSNINSIEELFFKKPSILSIVKLWFEGYKGFRKMQFMGYITKEEAIKNIEDSHKDWKKNE